MPEQVIKIIWLMVCLNYKKQKGKKIIIIIKLHRFLEINSNFSDFLFNVP